MDAHTVPEWRDMPEHTHYDIRILLVADEEERFKVSNESHDLRWVKFEEVEEYNSEPAFLRLIKKAKLLRG